MHIEFCEETFLKMSLRGQRRRWDEHKATNNSAVLNV